MTTTCCSMGIGTNWPCFSTSVKREPRLSRNCVAASRSEPNCANAATSRYCASSSLSEPLTCFIVFICAAEPTRETLRPTLMAGRMPLKKSSVSRKICPSVMLMTFVGMYAETSLPCVSTTGSAVIEPAPTSSDISPRARGGAREVKDAARERPAPGGRRRRSRDIWRYATDCLDRSS